MKRTFYYLAIFMMATSLFSSCIKDDDEPELNQNADNVVIDESFKATSSYLQDTWKGEYSGYDENQKANTNIRRELILNSDGTYKNTILGLLVAKNSNNKDYVEFEKEYGTYRYNGSNTITYTVQKDSLINYQTEKLEGYTKKHYYSSETQSYTEAVQFTTKDGSHAWVTKDVYLSNLSNKDLDLVFIMNK